MTTLSSALSSALSGLLVTSGQSAALSKNVTRANDQNYSRRDVELTLARDGTARLGSYSRNTDQGLQDRVLRTSSQLGDSQVAFDALSILSKVVGDPQDSSSVTAGVFELQQSLRNYQNSPSNRSYASAAISDARSLASRLNSSSHEIFTVRAEAHEGVKISVQKINSLLSDLQVADKSIRSGRAGTESYLDDLDKRDGILRQLSQEIGLRTVNKSDGGIALYTDSGITLFDVTPRVVELRADGPLLPGTPGPGVFIDGVQVSGSNTVMSVLNGKLVAQLNVRDETTLIYGAPLDEIARSLISLFAETDQSASPSLPPATGLFTYIGAPVVPAASTLLPGLAGQIKISALFDDQLGGNPALLRDGGSNGTAYSYNVSGASGFQERLSQLADTFDLPFNFDVNAKLGVSATIKVFAESFASRLATDKADASDKFDEIKASNQRWTEASLRATGVNLDEEMASLLSLEKSYQASAKVMTTIDQMFAVLVGIVR
jgi:flagellar hook-associated protein 1